MKILITGCGGFVGKFLLAELQKAGHQTVPTDRTGDFLKLDITDYENCRKVFDDVKPDVVYHLAAIAYVPLAEKDFSLALNVNVSGTINICKAALESGVKPKIIFISTANVYGTVTPDELPLTEQSLIKPDNNYALSKYMAEEVVRKYERESGQDCVVFRAFNHIGPEQTKEYVIPGFAWQLKQIAAGKAPAVLNVGNLAARRDFTDVRDIVAAYVSAANLGQGIYNLCSGEDYSIEDVLKKLIDISGQRVEVKIDSARFRKNDLPVLRGDAGRAFNDLNWKPQITLDQSLADIYETVC